MCLSRLFPSSLQPLPHNATELYLSSQLRTAVTQQLAVSQELDEINKMAAEEVEGNVSKEVFTSYTPKFNSSRPHPADIVEAASLAVSLPQHL